MLDAAALKLVPFVDVSDAPKPVTRTQRGVSDRSAQWTLTCVLVSRRPERSGRAAARRPGTPWLIAHRFGGLEKSLFRAVNVRPVLACKSTWALAGAPALAPPRSRSAFLPIGPTRPDGVRWVV